MLVTGCGKRTSTPSTSTLNGTYTVSTSPLYAKAAAIDPDAMAIDTEMNGFLDDEERAALTEEIPAGRMGTPEEAADTAFRIMTASPYLTGQVITLDGGWQ